MIGINRNNIIKARNFTPGFMEVIHTEIEKYKNVLSNPTSISSFENYKYHVGVIVGLDIALELFNQHVIEVHNHD